MVKLEVTLPLNLPKKEVEKKERMVAQVLNINDEEIGCYLTPKEIEEERIEFAMGVVSAFNKTVPKSGFEVEGIDCNKSDNSVVIQSKSSSGVVEFWEWLNIRQGLK